MAIEKVGLDAVKPEERKSWASIAFIWAGTVVTVPAFMVGGFITSGTSFSTAVVAMLIGYLICVAIMVLMGMQSADLGLPTVAAVGGAFGKQGSKYLISLIIALCFIGWFGFQTAVAGQAFSTLMGTMGFQIPTWISMLFWGAVFGLSAVWGINFIKILNIVAVPALLILIAYNLFVVFSDPEGAARIASHQPAMYMPLLAAVGMTVGGFAVGSVMTGDFTRYARDRKSAVLSSVVGVIPLGVATLIVGGILAIYTGALGMDNDNFVAMFSSIGSPFLALVVLIVATWTTNEGNAYSAGFAVLNLSGAKDTFRPIATLIAAALGTLLAILGVLGFFGSFLNLLAICIPPVAGCVIVDYWIINRGDVKQWKAKEGVHWIGLLSLVAGAGFALLFSGFFITPVNAIVVAGVVYFVLTKAFSGKKA